MSEISRETMDVDLAIVGAGPAGLACALRLAQLKSQPGSKLSEATIVLLEKSSYVGAHAISGAILDPRSLNELLGNTAEDCPVESPVTIDDLYFLSEKGHRKSPLHLGPLKNDGCFVISLHKLTKWLGEKVEAGGIDILPGFPGQELLYEDHRVVGVRTGDRGRDKVGEPKANFEPGVDIRAPLTILTEGARGSLMKSLTKKMKLDVGRNPQIYATGVKELWELPQGRLPAGRVLHTVGWPLSDEEYGGGFIYGMTENLASIGLAIGLDYKNPWTDPHGLMQRWKTHPMIRSLLEGGRMVRYGAKTIPEGGYFSIPKVAVDGCLIAGDAAGFLNAARLKGIHMAIQTGIYAAEAAAEAIEAGDTSESRLTSYQRRVHDSWVGKELYSVRNFRQSFAGGFRKGVLHAGLVLATGGRGLHARLPVEPDHTHMRKLSAADSGGGAEKQTFDGKLTFDKLTSVYASETTHEEDQPSHLQITDPTICATRCRHEYGNPCQYFCPASVYEMVGAQEDGGVRLQVNFTNCVHCKTCDIADPYEIIEWVPPEGGGGPNYVDL